MDRRGRPTLVERGILPSVPRSVPRPPHPAFRPVPEPPPRQLLEPVPRPAPHGAGRHCWVLDPPGLPGHWPGVLLEWRRERRGWQGWVSYVAVVGGRPSFVQGWLDADRLRPVPG